MNGKVQNIKNLPIPEKDGEFRSKT